MGRAFSYTPKRLVKTREKIVKQFSSTGRYDRRYSDQDKLRQLIKRLEKAAENNKMQQIALRLKLGEIYCLAYNLAFFPLQLQQQVVTVFHHRLKKRLIKILWEVYTANPRNEVLTDFYIDQQVRILMSDMDFPFSIFPEIFSAANSPLEGFCSFITNRGLTLNEFRNRFELHKEAALFREVTGRLLQETDDPAVYKNEAPEDLTSYFELFSSDNFRNIVNNYLLLLEYDEYHPLLMNFFKSQLGDPLDKYKHSWMGLSEEAREKAKRWYLEHRLSDFFDSSMGDHPEAKRRFTYWKGYLDSVEDVKHIEIQCLFLFFDELVVVEFGNVGNAAYIYERDVFERNFEELLEQDNLKSRSFKERSLARARIIHSGSWESKADTIMDRFV